jgi:hypothetical protein
MIKVKQPVAVVTVIVNGQASTIASCDRIFVLKAIQWQESVEYQNTLAAWFESNRYRFLPHV